MLLPQKGGGVGVLQGICGSKATHGFTPGAQLFCSETSKRFQNLTHLCARAPTPFSSMSRERMGFLPTRECCLHDPPGCHSCGLLLMLRLGGGGVPASSLGGSLGHAFVFLVISVGEFQFLVYVLDFSAQSPCVVALCEHLPHAGCREQSLSHANLA